MFDYNSRKPGRKPMKPKMKKRPSPLNASPEMFKKTPANPKGRPVPMPKLTLEELQKRREQMQGRPPMGTNKPFPRRKPRPPRKPSGSWGKPFMQ